MKSQHFGFVTGLSLLIISTAAPARDYYISGTGNDGVTGPNAGDVNNPYRTPAKVAALVKPGDKVWLKNGEYTSFTLSVSGSSPTQQVTWQAFPGHKPHITLKPGSWAAIDVQAEYQTIDGLVLTGNNAHVTLAQAEADLNKSIPIFFLRNPATGQPDINPATGLPVTADTPNPSYVPNYVGDWAFNNSGISLQNTKRAAKYHHLTVKNSVIRDFGCAGVAAIDADYTAIENNRIYNNSWYSRYGCSGGTIFTANKSASDPYTGYRNRVVNNMFWNNRGLVKWLGKDGGPGLSDGNGFIQDVSQPDYVARTLISGNIVVNNGGSGIHAFRARNVDIVNNTGYMNGQVVGYPDVYAAYSTNVRLLNNIVYARAGGTANSGSNNSNVVYNYNVYYNHVSVAAGTKGPNDLEADPRLSAPSLQPCFESSDTLTLTCTANFQPQGDSPAIDSGLVVANTTPTQDLNGTARPLGAGLDRGAVEYDIKPRIVSSLRLSGRVGTAFGYRISAYNFPTSYAVSGLPVGTGLSVNTSTGQISGTPQAVDKGARTITLRATNPVGTTSEPAQLTID